MTRRLTLGQHVELHDHLVRCHVVEDLVDKALEVAGVIERGRIAANSKHRMLWLPASFARDNLHRGLCLKAGTIDRIASGVVVRRSTLQQGFSRHFGYDDPVQWEQTGSTQAYHVAYDLNRKPVPVTIGMVVAWTPVDGVA
ncbi:hypothetical protein [Gordonia sp. (in: high G+C Gram-positive bacteria)]|uniref:hypothetical protein n=1 Tax=Gordonia sp. (in: high G+C Gram-positive bacteria) TaxID=84139 RepID=UPI00334267CC